MGAPVILLVVMRRHIHFTEPFFVTSGLEVTFLCLPCFVWHCARFTGRGVGDINFAGLIMPPHFVVLYFSALLLDAVVFACGAPCGYFSCFLSQIRYGAQLKNRHFLQKYQVIFTSQNNFFYCS